MQAHQKNKNEQPPDFVGLYQRYADLDNGLQAALRRVANPEELLETSAIYRLFHEACPNDRWLRVAFLLPWCEQCKEGQEKKAKPFGALLKEAEVNEDRLFQMARANEPLDIISLRRLAIQIKPTVDWAKLGWTLFKWGVEAKRDIIKDFFYYSYRQAKKGA